MVQSGASVSVKSINFFHPPRTILIHSVVENVAIVVFQRIADVVRAVHVVGQTLPVEHGIDATSTSSFFMLPVDESIMFSPRFKMAMDCISRSRDGRKCRRLPWVLHCQ